MQYRDIIYTLAFAAVCWTLLAVLIVEEATR